MSSSQQRLATKENAPNVQPPKREKPASS